MVANITITGVAADENQFAWSNLHEIKQYLLIFLPFFILIIDMYVSHKYTYLLIMIGATIIQERKLIKGGNY